MGKDDNNIIKQFNNLYNQCDISFVINQTNIKHQNKSQYIKILFRTEAMNDLNFISQYGPIKKETSCF